MFSFALKVVFRDSKWRDVAPLNSLLVANTGVHLSKFDIGNVDSTFK